MRRGPVLPPAAGDLVASLPDLVRVEPSPIGDRVQDTLRLLAAEVEHGGPGSDAVITRLADVLVLQAVRGRLQADAATRTGWLGALADDRIGRALAAVHREPERDWTVAALAATAAMSRSAFSARFTELVGEPAMSYVTRWRMHAAAEFLSGEWDGGAGGPPVRLPLRGGVRAGLRPRRRNPPDECADTGSQARPTPWPPSEPDPGPSHTRSTQACYAAMTPPGEEQRIESIVSYPDLS